jgi:hypothetical protein
MTSKLWAKIGAVVISAAALPIAPAAGATTTTAPENARNCVMVIDKVRRGEETSRVRSKECGPHASAPAETVLLMEWYEHISNSPSSFTRVYGDYGACDADGYRLRATGFWDNRISGFNTWNGCNTVTAYDLYNLSGDRGYWESRWGMSVDWVGSFMNDRISSFWIRHVNRG